MTGRSFAGRGGRVRVNAVPGKAKALRPVEEIVREMKTAQRSAAEDYRERSLAIHGLICARCSREFDSAQRHLLTVHHKDGNHQNNPTDGSNWENLCVYCHEDVHSRGILGEYFEGTSASREETVVYRDNSETGAAGMTSLGEQMRRALESKKQRR